MELSKIIFLSHPLTSDTPTYGNRDQLKISANSAINTGDTANSSRWVFTNNHIGTHIDVPYHFDQSGRRILDIEPEEWIFKYVALVDIPCRSARLIEPRHFANINIESNVELLLIRTGFEKFRGEKRFWNANPGFSPSLPNYFRKTFPALRCIGFDFISITSFKHRVIGKQCHEAFLCPSTGEDPILAIEDMSLANAKKSIDWVLVSPLRIEEGNGSPGTVFSSIK